MHVEFFYCKTQRVSCRKSNKLTSSRHTLQTHGAFRFVVRLKWSRRDQLSSFKINKCPIIEKMLLVTSQKSSYRSVYKHTQVRPSWRLRWWPNSRRGKANKLHAFLIVRNLNKSLSIVTAIVSLLLCVRNVAQRVNSLCFSLWSLLFHTVHSKSDNCRAALLSFSLISHSSLSDSQWLTNSVFWYICVSEPGPSAQTLIANLIW